MSLRDVSGRYRGRQPRFEVQLRVDVDGPRALNRVSADYFELSDGEPSCVGSMRVDAPAVTIKAGQVSISGTPVFSMSTTCKRIRIDIPRVSADTEPAVATLRHLTAPGVPGAVYECAFESDSFRVVELEEACEKGVDRIDAYDTGSLASRGAPRRLTHVEAFAEAGIELVPTGEPTIVDTANAGENTTWSDAELHAAMEQHFSRWGDRPRWAIWLLHAARHDDKTISGLMFDQRGLQRQGCAVFYGSSGDGVASPEVHRDRLHTCVHELGHGFNLPHSWQKSLTEPVIPSRPDADSWMNYPQLFPGGADAYWPAFDFGFDESELAHLRHAFEANVIMGGRPFGVAAGRVRGRAWDVDDDRDPGLRLKLEAPRAIVKDVPVTVGLELSAHTRQGRAVPPVMGPRPGNVEIAIRRPDGTDFVFEPLLHHCRGNQMVALRAGDAPIRDHAFIHFGRGGFAFERPGQYLVRARYAPPDGGIVLSNVAAIRVKPATSRVDCQISELIAGDAQVGTLFSLMGSDARALRRGDNKLKEIITRYPSHPVAIVARLTRAANLARGFKRLALDGKIGVRSPRFDEAAELVAGVIQHKRAPIPSRDPGGVLSIAPGVDPSVHGFFRSRLREATAAVPQRRPAGRGRPA